MKVKLKQKGGLISAMINPTADGRLAYFDKACLLWDEHGKITYFSAEMPGVDRIAGHDILLREEMIALPGLIDLHTHLPQYEFAAQGAAALLPWLEKYTFPQEARFAEEAVAELQSLNFFQSCLSQGTTTVVAYLSSHRRAAQIAFEEAERSGLRAYLGLTLMDRNVPAALLTTVKNAEQDMLALIERYHGKGKTQFVVTPRFAISCTADLLTLCGEISRAHNTLLQTHISENLAEIEETLKLFPQAKSYGEVYDAHGCLHDKTLLGHGIHLGGAERQLIKERGSVVVHCPVSNNFLGSGIMPYSRWQAEGLRLGLGTDVAAGYSLSMLNEAKQMTEMAKLSAYFYSHGGVGSAAGTKPSAPQTDSNTAVTVDTALCQATLGNAAVLGRDHELGSFAVGKCADIAIIDDAKCDTLLDEERNHYASLPERLARMIYRHHPEMVAATLIDGEIVFARE